MEDQHTNLSNLGSIEKGSLCTIEATFLEIFTEKNRQDHSDAAALKIDQSAVRHLFGIHQFP